MALRDQPYLPLYVQDFMTDEKLNECSAEATGVYIRLMCLMHKSEQYGMILLKQKDKQNTEQVLNFCYKLARHFPYNLQVIEKSIKELLEEDVIQIDGDRLYQKRMVKDDQISNIRASSGSKGGKRAREKQEHFATSFATAKTVANTEYENETEIEYESEDNKSKKGTVSTRQKKRSVPPTLDEIIDYAKGRNATAELARKFFDYYTADEQNPWCDRDGKKVKSWKQKFVTWQGREQPSEKTTNNPFFKILQEANDEL